jgi:hypothetical protein
MDVFSSRTARTDSWKVSNSTVKKTATLSMDTSNSIRSSQLEHLATAAETIGTSQTSTAEERPATTRMLEIAETSQQQY